MSRSVYVTGAASGNGRSITDRFLQAGDNVIAVDLDGAGPAMDGGYSAFL